MQATTTMCEHVETFAGFMAEVGPPVRPLSCL